MNRGKLIVVCGVDGCGKTSLVNSLKNYLDGKKIKSIVVHPLQPRDDLIKEILVFKKKLNGTSFQARMEQFVGDYFFYQFLATYFEEIEKNLRKGIHVICDRFIYSQIVNQQIFNNNSSFYEVFADYLQRPDKIFYLKASSETLLNRIKTRNTTETFSIEQNREYLDSAVTYFNEISERYPFIIIDAEESMDMVFSKVKMEIYKELE